MVQNFRLEFVVSVPCTLLCGGNISQLLPAMFFEKSQHAGALLLREDVPQFRSVLILQVQ